MIANNTINQPGRTGINVYGNNNSKISGNRISNVLGVHTDGIAVYDVNGHRNQNVAITNNRIDNAFAGITFKGETISGTQPNNLTIAYNLITNIGTHGFGVADWGYTNGANIFGNILLNSPGAYAPLCVAASSQNISYYNNILQSYGWLSSTASLASHTFSNNVALKAGYVPAGVNNTVHTELASILDRALALGGGVLPASIGSILSPMGPKAIGIDYMTASPT